jgi:hypothetical protein
LEHNNMFKKILMTNRGESGRSPLRRGQSGREADVSAQPKGLVRAAHAGEFTAENQHV